MQRTSNNESSPTILRYRCGLLIGDGNKMCTSQERYHMLAQTRFETPEEEKKRLKEQEYLVFRFYKKLGAWKD